VCCCFTKGNEETFAFTFNNEEIVLFTIINRKYLVFDLALLKNDTMPNAAQYFKNCRLI